MPVYKRPAFCYIIGIKPLKKQFNEEIKDYDPDYEAFCAAYGDDNY